MGSDQHLALELHRVNKIPFDQAWKWLDLTQAAL